MTGRRRIDRLEGADSAGAAVTLWLAAAQEYQTIAEYAVKQATHGLDHPLAEIRRHLIQSAPARSFGRLTIADRQELRMKLDDAAVLYELVVILDTTAAGIARRGYFEAAFYRQQLSAIHLDLLEGPPLTERSNGECEAESARLNPWVTSARELIEEVRVEDAARRSIEARYLGRRSTLFPATSAAWRVVSDAIDELADEVKSVIGMGVGDGESILRGTTELWADPALIEGRAQRVVDEARVTVLRHLGLTDRADAILRRRLVRDARAE